MYLSKTNRNFTFFKNYVGKLAERIFRIILQSVFEGHLLLLDWKHKKMVHIFISSLWIRGVCIIKIILSFRDLGKSIAASLKSSMFHGSVEGQDSLFYNSTSPWKVHDALPSRKAVCFSCISGVSGMSHCSYRNTWNSYFWIILWEAQRKRNWLLNRHVAVTRDSLSPFPPISSTTYFYLSG